MVYWRRRIKKRAAYLCLCPNCAEVTHMMKMEIALDEERILRDGVYDLKKIWNKIDEKFLSACTRERLPDGSVMYSGEPNKDYYTAIMLAAAVLKKQSWFARYCTKWIWYDNDDNEGLPFQEIDILSRQRLKNSLFAS